MCHLTEREFTTGPVRRLYRLRPCGDPGCALREFVGVPFRVLMLVRSATRPVSAARRPEPCPRPDTAAEVGHG
jgi:hypothetical protein